MGQAIRPRRPFARRTVCRLSHLRSAMRTAQPPQAWVPDTHRRRHSARIPLAKPRRSGDRKTYPSGQVSRSGVYARAGSSQYLTLHP